MKAAVSIMILIAAVPVALAQEEDFEEPLAHPQSVSVAAPRTPPLTLSKRYQWAARTSLSSQRLAGAAVTSAWSTAINEPDEYGPHWDGYAKRIGLRVASGATGTMMEASIGALWNEDPRYQRATGQPVSKRLGHVFAMTFLARGRDGKLMPAYARYVSVPGNSYLSNMWRPDSETDARHTAIRIPMAFLNRAVGNLVTEFWPDATKWLHRD
jgi:hypothetical protein